MERDPALRIEAFRCSFCERAQGEVAMLIAGPGVFICNVCAYSFHTERESAPNRCSFCRKQRNVHGDDVRICEDCLRLCDEILEGKDA